MIIVTGGAGFIGSALIWQLNSTGINDIVVVDRLGKRDGTVNRPGIELVLELRGEGAGVGELGGGAAAIVERGGIGRAFAAGDDRRQAVPPDRIAAIVDVGVVVGGDEGEIAVPKFALGVRVDGVEREHEIARRLEIGGQQHGIF